MEELCCVVGVRWECMVPRQQWGSIWGVPMSPVDFKKWPYRMLLSLIFPDVPCRIQETRMSTVVIFLESLSHVTRLHVP